MFESRIYWFILMSPSFSVLSYSAITVKKNYIMQFFVQTLGKSFLLNMKEMKIEKSFDTKLIDHTTGSIIELNFQTRCFFTNSNWKLNMKLQINSNEFTRRRSFVHQFDKKELVIQWTRAYQFSMWFPKNFQVSSSMGFKV